MAPGGSVTPGGSIPGGSVNPGGSPPPPPGNRSGTFSCGTFKQGWSGSKFLSEWSNV